MRRDDEGETPESSAAIRRFVKLSNTDDTTSTPATTLTRSAVVRVPRASCDEPPRADRNPITQLPTQQPSAPSLRPGGQAAASRFAPTRQAWQPPSAWRLRCEATSMPR